MLNLLESFGDLNSAWIQRSSGCYFDFQKVWQAFKPKAFFKKLESPWDWGAVFSPAPYPGFGDKKQKNRMKGGTFLNGRK